MTHDKLILEIEVIGYNANGMIEASKEFDVPMLEIVLEEQMRPEVGMTLVSRPGEKCLNDDFMVTAMDGRIVGARVEPVPSHPAQDNPQ